IFEAPVLQHLGVQEVLVDRGEFVVERLVEELDDLGIALHGMPPTGLGMPGTLASDEAPCRNANRDHPQMQFPLRRPRAQAARARGSSTKTRRARASDSSRASAVPMQLPQLEPQPVRMVSSAMLPQPAAAASRIWWSVTPLQTQTYTALLAELGRPHCPCT